jgi:hypothetical protein
MRVARQAIVVVLVLAALSLAACDTPHTDVVLVNDYAATSQPSLVVYRAIWLNVAFETPLLPGASSSKESALATSGNTAYVLLAPAWDPTSETPPASLIVLESASEFSLDFNRTLDIPVDDSTFVGNCAAQRFLTQAQADFVTKLVFADEFAQASYDPATCETTGGP